jgi:hypothetical protein
MSGGSACHCNERKEPLTVPRGSNRPARLWRVLQYRQNHSAFNGYHQTLSNYSSIACLRCGTVWRTKASYADALENISEAERFVAPGRDGYPAFMEANGRKVV